MAALLCNQCPLRLGCVLTVDELCDPHGRAYLLQDRRVARLGRTHVDGVAEVSKLGVVGRTVPNLRRKRLLLHACHLKKLRVLLCPDDLRELPHFEILGVFLGVRLLWLVGRVGYLRELLQL